jgi:putative zinc finger protein
MDHTQAIERQAAERYVLGELSASEAEDFERHFFECTDCSGAVEAGDAFAEGARVALRQPLPAQPAAAPRPRRVFSLWQQPAFALAASLAVVCAAIALYEGGIVIPQMRRALLSPVILPAFELAGASRGEAPHIAVPAGTPFLPLSADIPPDIRASRYRCVLSRTGQPVFQVTGSAPPAAQPVTILVPVGKLSSGPYELTIYAEDRGLSDKIASYPFQFEFH